MFPYRIILSCTFPKPLTHSRIYIPYRFILSNKFLEKLTLIIIASLRILRLHIKMKNMHQFLICAAVFVKFADHIFLFQFLIHIWCLFAEEVASAVITYAGGNFSVICKSEDILLNSSGVPFSGRYSSISCLVISLVSSMLY